MVAHLKFVQVVSLSEDHGPLASVHSVDKYLLRSFQDPLEACADSWTLGGLSAGKTTTGKGQPPALGEIRNLPRRGT